MSFSVSKLGAKATTGATALALFHRYNEAVGSNATDYDPYLIACSCIYLSGKADNDHQKLRDLINVSQTTLRKISEKWKIHVPDRRGRGVFRMTHFLDTITSELSKGHVLRSFRRARLATFRIRS